MEKKLYSLLSMAQKAGLLLAGEENCQHALRAQKAFLVLCCKDASNNTRSKFNKKCFFYKIPFYDILTKEKLNNAIGKEDRATIVIIDEGFSKSIIKIIESLELEDISIINK